jgi:hypothetical protein
MQAVKIASRPFEDKSDFLSTDVRPRKRLLVCTAKLEAFMGSIMAWKSKLHHSVERGCVSPKGISHFRVKRSIEL